MGCDIHLFVEYKNKKSLVESWYNFGGKYDLPRAYTMFSILANVRSYNQGLGFEPKGIASELSYKAEKDLYYYIRDDDECLEDYNGEYSIDLNSALDWEKFGSKIIMCSEGKPYKITTPEYHSHSYLSLEEYSEVIEYYKEHYDFVPTDYQVVLDIMESFEKNEEIETRIVFWFDN